MIRRRLVLGLLGALALCAGLLVAGGAWVGFELRGGLPPLDGTVPLAGLVGPVEIERDAAGVPTVTAGCETDAFRALGFLHGQDRFFQMDLSRRSAAGELAALVGAPAVARDVRARTFGLRERARELFAGLEAGQRDLVAAYAEGVNAGLASLDAVPPEYLPLRASPEPWTGPDTLLVIFSMFDLLQDAFAEADRELAILHDRLPAPLAEFLAPAGTAWDAPLDGSAFEPPPIPGPEVIDLRGPADMARAASRDRPRELVPEPPPVAGSNAWAVSGRRTRDGRALLANDMHLPIGVPNTWYRARLRIGDPSTGDAVRDVVGVSLPGVPGIVVGSNGHVAWGFTNSQVDTADRVPIELDPGDSGRYLAPGGPRPFEVREEIVEVKGAEPVRHEVRWTVWGPVWDEGETEPPVALAWVALEDGAVDLHLLGLARARSVDDAISVANASGMPAQNFLVADASGRIAWSLAGRIPVRVGCDGRLPASRADGGCRWDGLLPPSRVPRVVDPDEGLLWTANNRVVGGEALALLGDGEYAFGARARHIRDSLRAMESPDEQAMLTLQLDDRALFLARWRGLLLEALDQADREERGPLEALRPFVEDEGRELRAAVDSVGYRVVRGFRYAVIRRALEPLLAPCREEPGGFRGYPNRHFEQPAWMLVTERPTHLLDPQFESWDALLVDAAAEVLAELTADSRVLSEQTWGARNVFQARHPLGYGVPALGRYLDLPPVPLPGDRDMPLVQGRSFGASERLAVSPGHEAEGIFHMPGGASGHPLSPFYGAGHQDWVEHRAGALLPGETRHRLRLEPARVSGVAER